MKTIITATIFALASGSSMAFDLSSINDQEYYSGQPGSRLITNSDNNPASLYQDGHFPTVTGENRGRQPRGVPIGNALDQPDVYQEGHWPV